MSKVKRSGSKKPTRRKSKSRSAGASAPVSLRNWVEAQVRGARYRLANAAKLGGFVAAGLMALVIAALALFGQLGDVVDMAGRETRSRLADAGFAVRAIDVTGASGDVAHMIAQATEVYEGQSIFAVDPNEVRARIEALPLVSKASVARLWPNRISIVVETRVAYALWQIDRELKIIDRNGVVIADADNMNPPALPLVVDNGAGEYVVEIVEALALYPSISRHVAGAVRVGGRRWNLRLGNGADVKLPEGDVLASIAILAALQAERGILQLAAESFDLRSDGQLIIRALADRASVMERKA